MSLKGNLFVLIFMLSVSVAHADGPPVSNQTRQCIGCHENISPGIVQDWKDSRHALATPIDALRAPVRERRISVSAIEGKSAGVIVGCYECHGLNTDKHKDSFDHYGFRINTVVSPPDCATCHPVEAEEFTKSRKAHARVNIEGNPLYHLLMTDIVAVKVLDGGELTWGDPSRLTQRETCFGCHGTEVIVKGMRSVESAFGPVLLPGLINWPNQGIGRINPDGSRGACTACHPRHSFSMEFARKPQSCAECHQGAMSPAWEVYSASKHGAILSSRQHEWDFNQVPWVIGEDFKTPSCAACHSSLVVSPSGSVIAERTHDFGSRMWVRLFGAIYSHAEPVAGDTTIIRNKDNQPLPTAFTGEEAEAFLINTTEQDKRRAKMGVLCKSCHSSNLVALHWEKMESTRAETDRMTETATRLMQGAWDGKLANPKNPFDEPVEQLWIRQWLIYANSTRYASAMTGAHDYATFNNGWWGMTTNLAELREKIHAIRAPKGQKK